MTSRSGALRKGLVLRLSRQLAAATLVGIGLCGTALTQEAADEPPPLEKGVPHIRDEAIQPAGAVLSAELRPGPGILTPAGAPSVPPLFKDIEAVPHSLTASASSNPQEQSRTNLAFAEAHWKQGNIDRARSYYEAAIQCDPENVPARIGRAWAFVAYGDTSKALAELDAIIKQHPKTNARAYATRGFIRATSASEQDNTALDSAAADVDRALNLDPQEPDARIARAWLAFRRGNHDAAFADLDRMVEKHPHQAAALIYRGLAFAQKGDLDRALADLERAASSNPGWLRPMLLFNRGKCYAANGDFDRAIADLTAAFGSWPKNLVLYKLRAACYREKGDLEYALSDYDEILRLKPDDSEVYINRFGLLLKKGDNFGAMADVNSLVKHFPDSAGPYFFRAVVNLLAYRDERSALADMDRAVAINPRASFFYVLRGFLHARDARFIPTCLDIGRFILTFSRSQYSLCAKIDWDAQRFEISFGFFAKDSQGKPDQKADVSEFNQKCIDLGFQRLLVAALGSRNGRPDGRP